MSGMSKGSIKLQPKRTERVDTRGWIFGTWDFKWPQGYNIKIAFQKLTGDFENRTLEAAIDAFESAIAAWRHEESPANIRWTLIRGVYLPAPAPAANPEQPAPAESDFGREAPSFDYDILVSFATLPVTFRYTHASNQPENIVAPASELGRYATLEDYGTPTLFIGPVNKQTDLHTWLASDLFKPVCVHEFGHALGLAHTHQNPIFRRHCAPKLGDEARINAVLAKHPLGTAFNETAEEITSVWPHVHEPDQPTKVRFSDWHENTPCDATLEKHSCMAHPGWSYFLLSGPEELPAEIKDLDRPTEYDLDWLAKLYPPLKA